MSTRSHGVTSKYDNIIRSCPYDIHSDISRRHHRRRRRRRHHHHHHHHHHNTPCRILGLVTYSGPINSQEIF
jgi:hypothetical protein